MTGILGHSLAEADLLAVIQMQARANRVPNHYLYAELLMQPQIPLELSQALERKEKVH